MRRSTVVLLALFLATLALYFVVRPQPGGGDVDPVPVVSVTTTTEP